MLLIDAGNTRIKFALFEQGKLSPIHLASAENVSGQLSTYVNRNTTQCIIAAVKNSPCLEQVKSWCQQQRISTELLATPDRFAGLTNSYSQPQSLGIDRWLVMLGAKTLFPNQPLLIVDAGTATTLDCVNSQGLHLGGWIMPGLAMQTNALFQQAEKVIGQAKQVTQLSLAADTSSAVSQGTLAATLGFISQGISVVSADSYLPKVILTGGNSRYLSTFIAQGHCVVDDLIFHGMTQYC